ncbi:Gti1/Pac2 family-domain-containing protein [Mycena belliarum]|uniref:Gti1/Pac2 family-domain-containing protein n=1 Tax=Mycena belliarum TaxID=1033014 RepID=A0AAD6XYG0_9AGAR|nr:Gti1/Pac2 family-domain-containing protein [Mycena belliae]
MYEHPPASFSVTHPALRLFPFIVKNVLTRSLLDIRNASDVLVVLEAVRRGILPLISQRLSVSDRDQLRNGNVFVWEESQTEGGLVRWTDGRRWSQSKVCAECLLYEEKVEITEEEREAKILRRAKRICNPGTNIPPPRRNQRPSKSGGLTKQTYSFLVRIPGSREPRKWHTVAYTLWSDRASLPVIESYPELRDIRVPAGIFARNKASDTVAMYLSADVAAVDRVAACGGSANSPRPLLSTHSGPASGIKLPSFSPGRDRGDTVLPPVSWLKPLPWDQHKAHNFSKEVPPYSRSSVSQEDRRMLNSFQLRL